MLLENRFRPVQVVWAIDNSASMSEEVPVVQAGLNAFAQAISAASIDLRLVTISDGSFCVPPPLGSGNCPNDSNPPAFRAVDVAVTGGAALNQILQLFPQYAAGLAAGSQTYVGVVSDSDSSMSATEFSSRLVALDPMFEGWKFAGIYCPSTCTGSSACTAAGGVYRALVSATSGLEGNLCAAQTALSSLAARIVANAKLACFWDLPPSPEPLNPSHVNVEYSVADGFRELLPNVQSAADCGDGPGWYYDNPAWPTRFYFCPATCSAVEDAPDLAVSVLLGCATVVRP